MTATQPVPPIQETMCDREILLRINRSPIVLHNGELVMVAPLPRRLWHNNRDAWCIDVEIDGWGENLGTFSKTTAYALTLTPGGNSLNTVHDAMTSAQRRSSTPEMYHAASQLGSILVQLWELCPATNNNYKDFPIELPQFARSKKDILEPELDRTRLDQSTERQQMVFHAHRASLLGERMVRIHELLSASATEEEVPIPTQAEAIEAAQEYRPDLLLFVDDQTVMRMEWESGPYTVSNELAKVRLPGAHMSLIIEKRPRARDSFDQVDPVAMAMPTVKLVAAPKGYYADGRHRASPHFDEENYACLSDTQNVIGACMLRNDYAGAMLVAESFLSLFDAEGGPYMDFDYWAGCLDIEPDGEFCMEQFLEGQNAGGPEDEEE
jgi:hypothetical protein